MTSLLCPRCKQDTGSSPAVTTLDICPNCGYPATATPLTGDSAAIVIVPETSGSDSSAAETLILEPGAQSAPLPLGTPLPVGEQKFALVEEINRGGMGVILRGHDRALGRDVAIKVLRDPGCEPHRQRFATEARITGQLEHPNIVPIHELGVDAEGRPFFAMKLVRGRTLAEIIERKRQGDADPPLSRLVGVLIQICHAVAFAHARGVLHRDLKPSNIMLGDFGEVMLMDWGLAKALGGREPGSGAHPTVTAATLEETQNGVVLGTPSYMPPEQALGQVSLLDERSDVYALGAVLYELLTLEPPVQGSDVSAVLSQVILGRISDPQIRAPERDIPRDLAAVAMKALATRPQDRYASAAELRTDLESFLDGRVVSAREDNLVEVLVRFVRRHQAVSITAGLAFAALAALAIGSYSINARERERAERQRTVAEEQGAQAERERERAEVEGAVARSERARAEQAQRLAEEQRLAAEEARRSTVAALDSEARLRQRSERNAYLAAISLASEQLARRDGTGARATLDACPVKLRDWVWRRLALLCQPWSFQFTDLNGPVRRIAAAGDGRTIATAGDEAVEFHDLVTRKRVAEWPLAGTTAITLANDGGWAAAAIANRVLVGPVSSGPTHDLRLPGRSPVVGLAVALTGRLVAAQADGGLWSIDPADGRCHALDAGSGPIAAMALDHGNGQVLLVDGNGGLRQWDPAEGRGSRPTQLPSQLLALSGDGLVMASGSHIDVREIDGGRIATWLVASPPSAIALSSPGGNLALGSTDGALRVLTTTGGDLELPGHSSAVRALHFLGHLGNGSPRWLASGGDDGVVRLWDLVKRRDLGPAMDQVIAAGSAGAWIMVLERDGTARLIDLPDGRATRFKLRPAAHLAVSSDLIVLGDDADLTLLSRNEQHSTRRLTAPVPLTALALGAGGRLLAGQGDDGSLHVHDLTKDRWQVAESSGSGPFALASASPRIARIIGRELVIAHDGLELARWRSPHQPSGLALSSDGGLLAVWHDDQIRLWDAARGSELVQLRGHGGTVSAVGFSPDGDRVATACSDGAVRIFDTESGRCLLTLREGGHRWNRIGFAGDNQHLFALDDTGHLITWTALDHVARD